jgi:hypothetical protein
MEVSLSWREKSQCNDSSTISAEDSSEEDNDEYNEGTLYQGLSW